MNGNNDAIGLRQEWLALQTDHENYERMALVIKLVAILVCLGGIISGMDGKIGVLFMLLLWLQEGIWKTWQIRTAGRLLDVEKLLREETPEKPAFQFHTNWQQSRPGTIGLVKNYIGNSLKPTVAYPYLVLVVLNLLTL